MGVRMRINRAATGRRRSHHALSLPRMSKCTNCSAMHLRHRVCENCGEYKGKKVIDVEGNLVKKMERQKKRLKERGKDPTKVEEKEK